MSRIRSPNYPAFSLPTAIERAKSIHKAEGKNSVAREAMVKHIGFSSLNGASLTALSALVKYGLIEPGGAGGEARISDLAMKILFPHDAQEKAKAIQEAAFRPALFAKLKEKWPDRPPHDESLRSYLIREGFSASAVDQVIQFYRETLDMAAPAEADHDSSHSPAAKEASVTNPSVSPAASTPAAPPPPPVTERPFSVAFDGSVLTGQIAIRSVRDIDRLMKVLKAQKAAFEAMEDDDAGGDEDESSIFDARRAPEQPPVNPKRPPDGERAKGVPFMITQAQRQELRNLGYDEETIRQMTPEEAHKHLDLIG